jgi:ribosomal protein L37AE/L43A
MKEALNMIPESTNFRNNFSVASFTSNIMAIVSSNAGLLSSADKCSKCKKGTLRIESSGVYCNHCGHYQVHKKDLIPMAALPTFDQITKNLGVQAESPKPAAEPQTT